MRVNDTMRTGSILSRALAAILLVTVVSIAAMTCWTAFETFESGNAEITDLRRALGRFETIAKHQPSLDSKTQAKQPQFIQDWFLERAPAAIVSADLQTHLKMLAGNNGAKIVATNNLKTKENSGLEYLGVRVSVVGPMASLYRTLAEIETAVPFLFVETATFRVRSNTDQAITTDTAMELQMEVYGVQQPVDEKPSKAGGS